jgi:DNA-directed RNA polymerase sigma subunit (sigma70/sigma32)
MNINPDIDLGLAVARALNPGKQMTCEDIAAYANCSRNRIHQIEKRALAKVRKFLRRDGIEKEFADGL